MLHLCPSCSNIVMQDLLHFLVWSPLASTGHATHAATRPSCREVCVPEKWLPAVEFGAQQLTSPALMLQDYARWHSYQFYLSVRTVDPTMRPKGSLDVRPIFSIWPSAMVVDGDIMI